MATSLSGGWFSRRALLAAIGLLLLGLQLLAAAPTTRHAGFAADGAALSKLCEPHADERTPAPARDDHAPCCLYCAAGRDGPPLLLPDLGDPKTHPAPTPFFRFAYDGETGLRGRPIGWASSWSSRAPPLA
ncbi:MULTISPECIES: hypothetical protein [Methylosinus]|uniref:DUF2946 domain-containing protein n=1 Tax=Methylosinus trichosporium (strain ATCC 35070 / NCIMB 11131 / UNIQEM 75 / OB3b) TaxID=595536 RepID=A0A2D2CWH9_METT3|nr:MULTISPECIES: hypothetical protein [Methylosinus]ATQ67085.1 hypothetical protein CQW49_03670 [Methylosinus trichosporium OB3b]OBS51079.1 hypothetical protein A8B73_18075 [Methylosinus sp. 3S-1]